MRSTDVFLSNSILGYFYHHVQVNLYYFSVANLKGRKVTRPPVIPATRSCHQAYDRGEELDKSVIKSIRNIYYASLLHH